VTRWRLRGGRGGPTPRHPLGAAAVPSYLEATVGVPGGGRLCQADLLRQPETNA